MAVPTQEKQRHALPALYLEPHALISSVGVTVAVSGRGGGGPGELGAEAGTAAGGIRTVWKGPAAAGIAVGGMYKAVQQGFACRNLS